MPRLLRNDCTLYPTLILTGQRCRCRFTAPFQTSFLYFLFPELLQTCFLSPDYYSSIPDSGIFNPASVYSVISKVRSVLSVMFFHPALISIKIFRDLHPQKRKFRNHSALNTLCACGALSPWTTSIFLFPNSFSS